MYIIHSVLIFKALIQRNLRTSKKRRNLAGKVIILEMNNIAFAFAARKVRFYYL